MENFIPFKIQNLQGEIYQVVERENEMPIYQGRFSDCSNYLRTILLEQFRNVLLEVLPPN